MLHLRYGSVSQRLSIGQIALGGLLFFVVVTVATFLDVSAYLDRVASSKHSAVARPAFPLAPSVPMIRYGPPSPSSGPSGNPSPTSATPSVVLKPTPPSPPPGIKDQGSAQPLQRGPQKLPSTAAPTTGAHVPSVVHTPQPRESAHEN